MKKYVDTLLVIGNDKLREIYGNLKMSEAFEHADNVLTGAAKSIAEIISLHMHINVDFNDVNTVMRNSGVAIMGSATAEGDDRAIVAVREALNSPLLNNNDIVGATHVLLNITYGDIELTMEEMGDITDYIQDAAGSTAEVIFGHGYDPSLGGKVGVTLVATGFQSEPTMGFEKAPERNLRQLEDEGKDLSATNEIKAPLTHPTQQAPSISAFPVNEEPFLKPTEEVTPVAL